MEITFLLSKLKISTAVRIVQLVLISLNSELIKLFLLESYSTSIIPPSIGYNEDLTKKELFLKLKSNSEFANLIFLY